MARLTGIIALILMAVLVSDAYAYRTITTVEVNKDNERRAERCSQMRADEEIGSCVQYLTQQSRDVLQMRGIENQRRREGQVFDECCRELRNVDEQCRCELLEQIAMWETRKGRPQETRQMQQRARNLPSMCGLRPQQCYF
ncbi:hypothetical protein SDJN02_23144, partial [Cucurbita argyrosperma subsp. argyrosperma]|uniref:2S albumin-like n=1 Tax=Cucurbita moschata TaxID=3662 RepID=A0A6J1EW73_CUCMO